MKYWLFCFQIIAMWIVQLSLLYSADWPQWRGPDRDGVWPEVGIVETFSSDTLTPLWSVPVAAGYSGPTVAEGRVYVMDRLAQPVEVERIHCFDWKTGRSVWSYRYPVRYEIDYGLGPRASVTIDKQRAFALGAMGHFHCFDAATGEVLWRKDLQADYEINVPVWGIAASPLVYGTSVILLIGGSNGACLVAFDRQTGQEIWRSLDDPASYSSPILIEQAGRDVLVCWTGANVAGLDPNTGEVYWSYPTKPKGMINFITTPVFNRQRLFFTSFFDGSLMLRLGENELTIEKLWQAGGRNERNTVSLHATITTPIVDGDWIYGLDSYGEFRCLDASTGDRIWETDRIVPHGRWATIHLVRNGDRTWIYNEKGELIICRLSPEGYEEIDRAMLIEPKTEQVQRTYPINWSHPAFAYRHAFARSDEELLCVDLSADPVQSR